VWWVDPVGAILISCYIVWTWIGIASEQMDLMVCYRHTVTLLKRQHRPAN